MTTYVAQAPVDRTRAINDIVDRLKKQGLFDRFRKECLADVDTKPAYQNLQHRVEGAVARFLSTQKWRPDLNKNQLRDQLRRHITESQMLSTGVDRIVEQVVNPKISKVFKSEIDKAICEYLGVDQDEWDAKLRQRDELRLRIEQLEQQQKDEERARNNPQYNSSGVQQLMNIKVDGVRVNNNADNTHLPPPPTSNLNMPNSSTSNSINNTLLALSNTVPGMNMWNAANNNLQNGPQTGVPNPVIPYPPTSSTIPGYNYSSMTQQAIPGYPPSYLPGYPNMAYPPGMQMPGMPNQWPGMMGMTMPNMPPGMVDPATGQQQVGLVNPPIPGTEPPTEEAKEKKKEKPKKKELEPLTVESFLNIPLPKSEPPKPKEKKKEADKASEQNNDTEVVNIECVEVSAEQVQAESLILAGNADSSGVPDADGENKVYHFAWDNVEDDAMSDITVSSIHTSDLSTFYDDDQSRDHDLGFEEDWEEEEEEEDDEEEAVEGKEDEDQDGDNAVVKNGETIENGTPVSSPVKECPTKTEKPKARKLLSLSYNYSDSDDDETREERKARIAKEKEERYLRRQQRRAELEAKKKEREEERARIRAEKAAAAATKTKAESEDEEEPAKEDATTVQVTEAEEKMNVEDENKSEVEKMDTSESAAEPTPMDISVEDEDKTNVEAEKEDEDDKEKIAEKVEDVKEPEEETEEASKSDETNEESKEEKSDKESGNKTPVSSPTKPASPQKRRGSPRKRPRISKEEAKEILREQKVMEKRMALRRQRTKNRRYLSDEFTSIFTERKNLLSGVSEIVEEEVIVAQDVVEQSVEIENSTQIIEIDLTQGLDTGSTDGQYTYTVPQAQEEVITAEQLFEIPIPPDPAPPITRSRGRQAVQESKKPVTPPPQPPTHTKKVRPDSPYSDISDSSKSELSDDSEERYSRSRRRRHSDSRRRESPSPEARTRRARGRQHSPSPVRGDSERYSSQRYDSSDLYKPRMSFGGSRRRARSPSPEETKLQRRSAQSPAPPPPPPPPSDKPTRHRHDTDQDSVYEPITTPEPEEFEDPKSDDERSSEPSSRISIRSRSRSRLRSRTRSMSRSRSRSRSYSRSRSRSRSRTRSSRSLVSKSSSRSRSRSSRSYSRSSSKSSRSSSYSRSHDDSEREGDDDEEEEDGKRKHQSGRVPVDRISFGEAAKRAKRKFIEDVDFGEAARQMHGGPQNTWTFPARGTGRPRGTIIRPPIRGVPPIGIRAPFPGTFTARPGIKRGMPPIHGGSTSPRGGSGSFRGAQGPPFPPYQRSKFPAGEGPEFPISSPEKHRPWLRSRSSDGEGSFTRSKSQEDVRSRSPPSDGYGHYRDDEDEEGWRSTSQERRQRSSRSPLGRGGDKRGRHGEVRGSPEMEEGEMRTPSDDESDFEHGMREGPSHSLRDRDRSPPIGSPPRRLTPGRRDYDAPPPPLPPPPGALRRPKHPIEETLLRGPPRTRTSLAEIRPRADPRRAAYHEEGEAAPEGFQPGSDNWRMTRATRKRTEEEMAPIAKRLRHH